MWRRDFRNERAEHDELATLGDRDQDRDAGQDGGSGERRVRERCEQDREQPDCEYGAGGEQAVRAANPRDQPCRRYLRYDDEEGVDEDDDTDLTGPDRCMRHRKRREDVGEERAADHHKREVARDQGEQEPIPSNGSETLCVLARRRSIREARIRYPDEHNQREEDERDCVEEEEALERPEVMRGAPEDEARTRRAEAETEVACDSSERGRCGALLRRDQGQGQDLAGGSHESEAGTADGRADEALPRTVDKRQAPVAECVQNIARDQDPFRTETIEERTRRERYHRGRAHDRRQHQPRGRRREAADRVEVDDLEGAKGGDERAFASLVEPFRRELQLHCYRLLGSVQDAEDLVQETLLAAWRGLNGFEERASLRSWLYRIATNRSLNAIRERGRRPATENTMRPSRTRRAVEPSWLEPYADSALPDPAPGPEARYEQREAIQLSFIVALQQLPAKQRAALVLRDVLGFHTDQAASILETTPQSVKAALQRARATPANGQRSFGYSLRSPPRGMMVLTLSGSKVDEITFFADPALPGRFGLPEPI